MSNELGSPYIPALLLLLLLLLFLLLLLSKLFNVEKKIIAIT